MVRTYKPEKYQLVSPWEKAMRTADAEEGRPVNTGKRVYTEMKVTNTSFQHDGTQKNIKLPPITGDPQKTITFLAEEVGKSLARTKEKIKTINKEFILYDPSDTGLMSKSSALEILQRYRIPENENYQTKVLAFFVDEQQPGKVKHHKLIEFMQNSRKEYLKKIQFNAKHETVSQHTEMPADNTHGRYDSTKTMNEIENKPRKAHQQAFLERRDVGLQLDIERALKNTHRDPHDILDELENDLRRTCQNDDFMSDNGHVRSLVSKHQIPINTALTLKCIERLDPYDTGKIEWPKFIKFLRKPLGGSPRRSMKSKTPISELSNEFVPSKPAWETRLPLTPINNNSNNLNNDINIMNKWKAHETDFTTHNYMSDYNNQNEQQTSNDYQADSNRSGGSYYGNSNDYGENYKDGDHNEDFPHMDGGIDEAFARNIEEIRRRYEEEEQNQNYGEQQAVNQSSVMGEDRADLYKRVSNALEDKAKLSNGMLLTDDVRKIINYYNVLFDADFPMDQLNAMLQRYSNNDQIHCHQVVAMFGKEIV